MAETKTRPTPIGVADFIDAIENPARREDAKLVCAMLERVTGESPRMWGPSIVGFGSYQYRYDSGHAGEMCRLGFSPRKAELVLYILTGGPDEADKLAQLGKHKTGKSCLYIKKLSDVDMAVLEQLSRDRLDQMERAYPST